MADILDHFNAFAESPSIQGVSCHRLGPVAILTMGNQAQVNEQDLQKVLHATELAYSQTIKSQPRREEFLRARWLMRSALKTSVLIPRNPDGTHIWPQGLIGSITHKQGFVGVTFADGRIWRGLGIDAEMPAKMQAIFAERLLTQAEKDCLDRWSKDLQSTIEEVLTIIFSFKESIFKAIFPLGREMFYFPDARVDSINPNGIISATLLSGPSPLTPAGTAVSGYFKRIQSEDQDLFLSGLLI